jgi:hypothetical protein
MNSRRWFAGALVLAAALLVAGASVGAPPDDEWSGRWMLVQVTGTVASIPVVGDMRSTTTTVALLDLDDVGDRLRGRGITCSVDIDSGSSFVDTRLPAALLRALPKPELDARIYRKDGKVTLYQPPRTIVLGAKLERPSRDRLPQSPDDSRVRDQDKDGKPGVTVLVSGLVSGEIYVAQRNWVELRGKQRAANHFQGKVRFGNEQVVLGASTSMLESSPNARPDPGRSYFHLVKVPKRSKCKSARRRAKRYLR